VAVSIALGNRYYRPKTDEVERAFSAAGTLCTRISSGLGDDALDELLSRSFYRRRYEATRRCS